MGVAALVIGIISVILGFVPLCNYFAVLPAIVGLVLGIVEVTKKGKAQQPKGLGMAGIILNAVAIVVILLWTLLIAGAAARAPKGMEQFGSEMNKAMEDMAQGMEKAAGDMQEAAGDMEDMPEEAAPTE